MVTAPAALVANPVVTPAFVVPEKLTVPVAAVEDAPATSTVRLGSAAPVALVAIAPLATADAAA